jgi:hypothetical protein
MAKFLRGLFTYPMVRGLDGLSIADRGCMEFFKAFSHSTITIVHCHGELLVRWYITHAHPDMVVVGYVHACTKTGVF